MPSLTTSKALPKGWALLERQPENLSIPTVCFQTEMPAGKAHELGFSLFSNASELLSGYACTGQSPHLVLH